MDYYDLTKKGKEEALDRGFVPMFASRDSVLEAQEYMDEALESLEPHDKVAVITAMQVLENTKIMVTMEIEVDDIMLME